MYQIEAERYVQENIIEKVMLNKVEPLKRELETFIDCVNKSVVPDYSGTGNTEPRTLRKNLFCNVNPGRF